MTPNETVIPDFQRQLETLPELIEKKGEEVILAREGYLKAKANYEFKYNEIYLSIKIKWPDATQGDLKAEASNGSHQERINMIVSESNYRRKQKEITRLRDDLDSAKEQSYNQRAEIRRFG